MTIADYVTALERAAADGAFYDNGANRCAPPPYKGRDCSTFVAYGLIDAGYPNVNPCNNSYGFADECWNTPRPDWFTHRFGPGPGTYISYQDALHVVCWGFHGADYGRGPDENGDGHIETSLGNGGGSIAAHSHATGVGYATLTSFLQWYAVPPQFLDEMAPPVWKVQPMFNPPQQVAAWLQNPQGGWWLAAPDAHVTFLAPSGQTFNGGLVQPGERAAWNSSPRQVAHLKVRWYRPKGSLVRKAGYSIVATDGNVYTPAAQH